MSQYSYYQGSATTVYTTGSGTVTVYPTGGGSSAVGPPVPSAPPRDLDPISWLKARVQETIDAVKWP